MTKIDFLYPHTTHSVCVVAVDFSFATSTCSCVEFHNGTFVLRSYFEILFFPTKFFFILQTKIRSFYNINFSIPFYFKFLKKIFSFSVFILKSINFCQSKCNFLYFTYARHAFTLCRHLSRKKRLSIMDSRKT